MNIFSRVDKISYFSHYRFQRYDDVIAEVWYGNKNKSNFLVWENEMLEAEALVRTGNVAGAVAILNDASGARKVRGLLPDVTATDAATVLLRIYDEKDVELMDSGMGIGIRYEKKRPFAEWYNYAFPCTCYRT